MSPLPNHIPQCKALYDFRMTNDDEEGCLTFNKVCRKEFFVSYNPLICYNCCFIEGLLLEVVVTLQKGLKGFGQIYI